MSKSNSSATIVALLLVLSATANAEIKEKGAYVGASLGAVSYNQNGDDLGDIETDGKEAAYGLYGGYKFMRHFALEGRYTNLGDHKLKSGDTEVGSSDFSVISLNLIGLLPLGDSDWDGPDLNIVIHHRRSLLNEVTIADGFWPHQFV